MPKSGKVQKSMRSKPKIKADAVSSKVQKGKKQKKLGDSEQSYGQDSRKIEKQIESTEVSSDPQ